MTTVLLASAWFAELADRRDWKARIARSRDQFLAAKAQWAEGRPAPLYDPRDLAAWYVFQANRAAIESARVGT
jgi:hypothetical protein